MKQVELCVSPKCRSFTRQVNHDYCPGCRRIVKDIQSRFRHTDDGRKPSFETAISIAWRALRIFYSPYSAPEQIEWATMAYPEGMAQIAADNTID